MMENPLVSVIIPVYNVEAYLKECIESVLSQTYQNLDIIIVDDGSTDRSGEMCDDIVDERVRVVHQANAGLSAARNHGIELAKGEIISFIDSDDVISHYMIENMAKAMVRENVDIVCCDYTRRCEELWQGSECIGDRLSKEYAISHFLDDKGYRPFAWNKLYRIELFKRIRYPVGEYYEDIKTTYMLMKEATSVYYIHAALYYYRQRSDAITGTKDSGCSYDRVNALNTVMRDCKRYNKKIYNKLMLGYVVNYLYYINSAIRGGKNTTADIYKVSRLIRKQRFRIGWRKEFEKSSIIGVLLIGIMPRMYNMVYGYYIKKIRKSKG
ncbi:MAG: glycosyltransferase [Lachnospiraceae bacterium]|nr:glycosyltransferase [Lachnospiraceae bacterium]MBO6300511.1 glycosyltransferase [Lachnospiraceae bacterium]